MHFGDTLYYQKLQRTLNLIMRQQHKIKESSLTLTLFKGEGDVQGHDCILEGSLP